MSMFAVGLVAAPSLVSLVLFGLFSSDRDRNEKQGRLTPPDQQRFIDTVNTFGQRLSGEHLLAQQRLRRERGIELCKILPPNLEVRGWIGRFDSVSSTNNGRAVPSIYVLGIGHFESWNTTTNAPEDRFPIAPDTPMHDLLQRLKAYDLVRFDGRFLPHRTDCIRDRDSRTADESGSVYAVVRSPHFVFQFTGMHKVE